MFGSKLTPIGTSPFATECHAGQAVWLRLRLLRHFRGQLLLALAIGVAAGVAGIMAAPWLAALLSGLGGFMTAIVVQGGVLLLRLATVSYPPRA